MVVNLPNTQEMIEISSDGEEPDAQIDGEPEEEPEEDPIEDPGMDQLEAQQRVEDLGSAMSWGDTSSSSDSDEELEDEYDSDYDPFWDLRMTQLLFLLGRLLFEALYIQYNWVRQLHFALVCFCITG